MRTEETLLAQERVKLHALKGWLPGKVLFFYFVPLDRALKGMVKGHLPVKSVGEVV